MPAVRLLAALTAGLTRLFLIGFEAAAVLAAFSFIMALMLAVLRLV